jgi:uncharacterized pyridoxamine 5'-phosphate oxidase family protein
MTAGESRARAQNAETLSQIKKVYVESFGRDDAARDVRDRMIRQLRKNRKVEVVTVAKEADVLINNLRSSNFFNGCLRVGKRTAQPYSRLRTAPARDRQPGMAVFEYVKVAESPSWANGLRHHACLR